MVKMNKKLVLIGLGLIILAIIFLAVDSTNGIGGNKITENNLTIGANSFSYLPVNYGNNVSILAVDAVVSAPVNIYVLNVSTFSSWDSYMQSNKGASGLSYVKSLGVNSTYILENKSVDILPISLVKNNVLPDNLAVNKLYIVVDNTPGSQSSSLPINATLSYLTVLSSKVSSALIISFVFGIGFIVLLGIGIVVIVYGIFKKSAAEKVDKSGHSVKSTKDQKNKEYVDQLYKGVKTKKKKSADDDT
jgi:F0F1-type ATP synthase assembly protein I